MAEPAYTRHRSKQDYGTPVPFLQAVLRRLGRTEFAFDFAADADNSVALCYWDVVADALGKAPLQWAGMTNQPIDTDGWGWLNPPFAQMAPWVMRAYQMSRSSPECFIDRGEAGQIAVLVPAGAGSNWWRDWVHDKALVLLLNGRLTFEGQTQPYPKDCALLLYGPQVDPGYEVWNWRG